MKWHLLQNRRFLIATLGLIGLIGLLWIPIREYTLAWRLASRAEVGVDGIYHVYPGQRIQDALNAAAFDADHKTVHVHAGTYRPQQSGQALIWLHRRHDGITLEAVGDVTLSAANPEVADKSSASFPAIVNHVVYVGDGISSSTVIRGFRITGANHFVTEEEDPDDPVQPATGLDALSKQLFFYADGGAVKVFGRSYPTLENLVIEDNYASPCGGGISIEHRGFRDSFVTIKNCIFRANRCQVTGSAIDVLPESSALIENCLFVDNVSNTGEDLVGTESGPYNGQHGSGALTVFPDARVRVANCTFTQNWNGVDDKGAGNSYANCIFWQNTRSGGICLGERYEVDILSGENVVNCHLGGPIPDLRGSINTTHNNLDPVDPLFDVAFRPSAAGYEHIGYRPMQHDTIQ